MWLWSIAAFVYASKWFYTGRSNTFTNATIALATFINDIYECCYYNNRIYKLLLGIAWDCSELGAPDFLIQAIFHFTWCKGGDGGKVTPVSTFSDPDPYLDCFFSTISDCSRFRYPERDSTCGVTFFKALSWSFFRRSCHKWNKQSELNNINLLMLYK